mgnify:CR=1 FL=1
MKPQERYAEIEAREKAATKGPWDIVVTKAQIQIRSTTDLTLGNFWRVVCGKMLNTVKSLDITPEGVRGRRDMEFIAHTRADIPYLLARVRRAEELLRDLGRVYDNHGGTQEINVFLTENQS